jgi:putative nucleotidyltransferase with HDIG domain
MDKYEMLEHIKAHSLVVAKVAHFLARTLFDTGIGISVEKTTAGALMHDIGKTASLHSGQDHTEIGRQICLENNLYEIADIVGEHVRLKNYNLNGRFSEKEIVFYSDKRVNHATIVGLEDRQTYILERYGQNHKERCDAIRSNFNLCREVETKLFNKLNVSADKLARFAAKEDILGQR